mgnify:FL=1
MSEEFKYIPYSPDDENLRGLIRDGNVYNIKTPVIPGMGETGGYSMSSTGIMLPDCDDGTDEMMRDIYKTFPYRRVPTDIPSNLSGDTAPDRTPQASMNH